MKIECRRDPDSPYIMVWVRVECKNLSIRGNTEFAVDTGSPMSILSYEQGKRLNVPIHQLKSAGEIRIGGTTAESYLLPDVDLFFRTTERAKLFAHRLVAVHVLGPSRTRPDLPVPGILGMNFLEHFTFVLFSQGLGGRIFITDENPTTWGELP